jgi:hypothetical protein
MGDILDELEHLDDQEFAGADEEVPEYDRAVNAPPVAPPARPEMENRQCAKEECVKFFKVLPTSSQKYCSQKCEFGPTANGWKERAKRSKEATAHLKPIFEKRMKELAADETKGATVIAAILNGENILTPSGKKASPGNINPYLQKLRPGKRRRRRAEEEPVSEEVQMPKTTRKRRLKMPEPEVLETEPLSSTQKQLCLQILDCDNLSDAKKIQMVRLALEDESVEG